MTVCVCVREGGVESKEHLANFETQKLATAKVCVCVRERESVRVCVRERVSV